MGISFRWSKEHEFSALRLHRRRWPREAGQRLLAARFGFADPNDPQDFFVGPEALYQPLRLRDVAAQGSPAGLPPVADVLEEDFENWADAIEDSAEVTPSCSDNTNGADDGNISDETAEPVMDGEEAFSEAGTLVGALHGSDPIILVEGDTGSGKTTLQMHATYASFVNDDAMRYGWLACWLDVPSA